MLDVTLIISVGVALLLGYVLVNRKNKHQPLEPPLISSSIPVIGHLAAFIYYGLEYFASQSAKIPLPAFSLDMLFNKVYVIKSPELVSAVRRNHRSMSLEPLLTRTSECAGGITGPGLELLRGKESQGQGLGHHTVTTMRPTLLGQGLDEMNTKMMECVQKSVQELRTHRGTIDIYQWCTLAMTIASTDAIYGPLNPYKQRKVRDSYWEIENNLSYLMMDFAPWLIARKAWKGREYLSHAFLEYYEADGHLNSSQLAYTRWKTQLDGGARLEDIARLEAVMGLGILSNTVPSSYWAIFDLFSRPELLKQARDEIRQHAMSVNAEGLHTVDLAAVQEKCPLLLACLQETLRLRSNSAQLRVMFEDTMLGESCLVKAGSILLMPSAVINRSESAWGNDAESFDPQRFIDPEDRRTKASGFMSFGASPHICAGRHFATGEIIALMTMLILQFDICPVGGEWVEPPINVNAVAASLSPPIGQTPVNISEREEFKGVEWNYRLTPGKGRHGLIIG
ncbi:hypothetical protein PENANT_c016G03031 [Penicillium antarcticum]|uniref:Cytochrome P450 n=1 Tax=Penicillium antarcticum TaxID=416450 RepID=A0A1V6Q3U3_9EURO|nr:uncharacterized protein N7508_001325 [Penicillium antarcticum]KAJ5316817.1 hypothetical protein N7508_001325 [Penicillium antarcticum]OQD83552.1 hypothetical protein PENANT_c016G03031 [Penicillium antarcticum]